jgi:hypothetical protein
MRYFLPAYLNGKTYEDEEGAWFSIAGDATAYAEIVAAELALDTGWEGAG